MKQTLPNTRRWIRCDADGSPDKNGTCVRDQRGGKTVHNMFEPSETTPKRFQRAEQSQAGKREPLTE